MMKSKLIILLVLTTALVVLGVQAAYSWTPTPVKDDHNVFMPGSQPGEAGVAETPDKCDNCHGGYNAAIEPAYNWRGSMMAQAARDPLWLACLTVSDQDSIWAVGNPNAGDICIRCHSPVGWLEGRSDPTNTSLLKTKDFDGVQCDFCHRKVDPFTQLHQPDVGTIPGEPSSMVQETYMRDLKVLGALTLFDGTAFLNPTIKLPTYYGNGSLPNYAENGAGQYFVDPSNAKSGPFWDAVARHQIYYSRYHRSKTFCHTCHDVSNPILASLKLGADVPEKQAAASYYHVERTHSEFLLSAYGRGYISGVSKCQDCHMRDVTGTGCDKPNASTRNDLPLHDMTGGNAWVSKILASTDPEGPVYDPYNYAILSGQKYAGAQIDVSGLRRYGQALLDGADRAVLQLEKAATLSVQSEDSNITLRVKNNTGHKLISGFPEGRRMFLNVKFYDSDMNLIGEVNPYEPLETTRDDKGNEVHVSGGDITEKNESLVWEAEMSSTDLTEESKTFHFALASGRYKDNRIPPKGFNVDEMYTRLAQPRWHGEDTPNYFTAAEYEGGYDDVIVTKPSGTAYWQATLYYQTTSKEYVEFLKDEINGDADTLSSPTPSGEPKAYIVQTDPFFANLKGWGNAIWDLWLHNGGAKPVVMAQIQKMPCKIEPPQNLTAIAERRGRIALKWSPVAEAEGYNVYYSKDGVYTFITSTTHTSYIDKGLKSGDYCYVVTAYRTCNGEIVESDYSNEACATVR